MAQAFKLVCPETGEVTAFDCLTGKPLTAEQLAGSYSCANPTVDKVAICVQPIGNADKELVEPGYCISVITADPVSFECTVQKTSIFDSLMVDITATHEAVKCPAAPISVGTVCYGE